MLIWCVLAAWPACGGRAVPTAEPAADAGPAAPSGAALTGELLLGPPKSKAGRRIVGIPGVIDFHVQAERDDQGDDDEDGSAGPLVPAG